MTYSEKLKDPRWQKKRLEVMCRDEFTCRDCGDKDNTLHVHHCAYAGREPWAIPMNALLTLCLDCHEARQLIEDDAHLMLGKIMARLPHRPGSDESLMGFVGDLSTHADSRDTVPTVICHHTLSFLEAHCVCE